MSTASPVALLAGLGNPGSRYADTRHNVGHWFIEMLQRQYPISFKLENKFKAETGHFQFEERTIRVVVPNTYMNLSGQSIAPMASFYRIPAEQILIVHDELDLDPGTVRLKVGGGHGGHNGLREISPGASERVTTSDSVSASATPGLSGTYRAMYCRVRTLQTRN